jgi:L-asparagine permease
VTFATPLSGHNIAFSMMKSSYTWLSAAILPAIAMIQSAIFSHGSTEVLLACPDHAFDGGKSRAAVRQAIVRMTALNAGTALVLAILVAGSVSPGHLNRFSAILGCIGIYATGRTLRSLALSDSAHVFLAAPDGSLSGRRALLLTALAGGSGVVLNQSAPEYAFELVITAIVLLSLALWSLIVKCRIATAEYIRATGHDLGGTHLSKPLLHRWAGPLLLGMMLLLVMLDYPIGTFTATFMLAAVTVCWIGWLVMRSRLILLVRRD